MDRRPQATRSHANLAAVGWVLYSSTLVSRPSFLGRGSPCKRRRLGRHSAALSETRDHGTQPTNVGWTWMPRNRSVLLAVVLPLPASSAVQEGSETRQCATCKRRRSAILASERSGRRGPRFRVEREWLEVRLKAGRGVPGAHCEHHAALHVLAHLGLKCGSQSHGRFQARFPPGAACRLLLKVRVPSRHAPCSFAERLSVRGA